MQRNWTWAIGLSGVVLLSGCTDMGTPVATAELHKVTASGIDAAVAGTVEVLDADGELRIRVDVGGLAEGEHGIHIHDKGSCAPGPGPDGNVIAAGGAGGHFNPTAAKHGDHAGDLGNVEAGGNGDASATLEPRHPLTVQPGNDHNILGRTVVIHEKVDDGVTDPSGNSGARVMCGVIQAA